MLRAYGDGSVFGELYGEGPVRVVWLHGWGRTHEDFTIAGGLLADRGVASVALDLPGFGSSPLPERTGGARMYAELLEPLVTSMASEPLVLVGHSFGGRVATVLAAQRSASVRALVLCAVPLLASTSPARSPLVYRVIRSLSSRRLVPDSVLESARQRYGSRDYRAARGQLRDILVATVNESYGDELSRWRGPTAMVWGADDTETPVAGAERARGVLGEQSSLVVLNGVGHFVPTQAPAALVDAVTGVLA